MKLLTRFVLPSILTVGLCFVLPVLKSYADVTRSISVNVQNAGPRQVEDTTERAVARDYAGAWQAMTKALDQNRTDVLGPSFIGNAKDKLAATIADAIKTANLVSDQKLPRIREGLAKGNLSASDWKLLAELALPQDKGGKLL